VCVCGFCDVCVCVGFVMCGCLGNMYTVLLTEVFINLTEVSLTRTVGFPCFFLSCKANARVKTRKDGARARTLSHYLLFAVFRLLFVLFCVLFVCKCVLPPGDNPIAVNKYIIQGVRKRLYLFQKFFFGPLLFGGRHLENFVPTGTAGISIKSRSI
jgi:hypothetical protein